MPLNFFANLPSPISFLVGISCFFASIYGTVWLFSRLILLAVSIKRKPAPLPQPTEAAQSAVRAGLVIDPGGWVFEMAPDRSWGINTSKPARPRDAAWLVLMMFGLLLGCALIAAPALFVMTLFHSDPDFGPGSLNAESIWGLVALSLLISIMPVGGFFHARVSAFEFDKNRQILRIEERHPFKKYQRITRIPFTDIVSVQNSFGSSSYDMTVIFRSATGAVIHKDISSLSFDKLLRHELWLRPQLGKRVKPLEDRTVD